MTAKLHIDASQGILDIEGDEAFVKSIYDDFKEQLSQPAKAPNLKIIDATSDADLPEETKPVRRKRATIRRQSESGKGRIGDYSPKFNPNLDLGKLEDFYAKFEPKNHREKILIFAVFLREELGRAPCEADDIFSCYQTLKAQSEIPEAFIQAIRDTHNKGGYIDFVSPTEIRITIAGENYFNQKLKRKESAK